MKIRGYLRPDGKYGVRNHLLVIPTSVCASDTASRIAAQIPGAVAIPHQHGCCEVGDDYEQTVRTLIGFGKNPNVGAALVIGLGCEGIQAGLVAEEIAKTGKRVEMIVIQEHGGTLGAIQLGTRLAAQMSVELSRMEKVEFDMSRLILGLECGGSDPTSGIASNPVMGACSDLLLAEGGTSILSESAEMIGAEHLLAARATTPEIGEKFLAIVRQTEQRAVDMGHDLRGTQPTPGNIEGGITTIEEKSLGCIYKAGNADLVGTLDYSEEVPALPKGLFFMDTPGEDIDSITGMVAGGAQIVTFTTGRGTPTGCPIAPVIKLTGNSDTYGKMLDNIDFNAGRAISGEATVDELGRELFDELVEVCNGKLTKAESLGHNEFGVFRIGYTF
ncbi:MAG: UxaA family hydrolase [Oscillospiraceae bacterium]